jgi:hypothetical protein
MGCASREWRFSKVAFIKAFRVPETGADHPEAYWRVRPREEGDQVAAQIEIFAHAEAAGKGEGPRLQPVYRLHLPVDDGAVAASILGKASPVPAPQGTPERERYHPTAQLYRHLRSLESFADAVDLK